MTNSPSPLVEGENRNGNVLILRIRAAHIRDSEVSYALLDRMTALVEEAQRTDLVIDFSDVEFMGSIGFLALMKLRREVPGGTIILTGLSETLRATFTACRLIPDKPDGTAVFGVNASVEEALRQFNQ